MGECHLCGANTHLHVHHIDGDHDNNDGQNLASLCVLCHRVVERNYGAADPTEFSELARAIRAQVEAGEAPWQDAPAQDAGRDDLPLFSNIQADFVPHRERNFPGIGAGQARIWSRPPAGREWEVEVRPRAPHVSGGRRAPRIIFSRGGVSRWTDYWHHRSLRELTDQQLEELWKLACCRDVEEEKDKPLLW